MKTKRIIAALAAAVMLASNQSVAAGVSYAAEAIEESQIVYGEVNGDGKVGISDAVAILQYIANRDKYPLNAQALRNADCVDHGDGVTGMDAFALKLVDADDIVLYAVLLEECLNPPAEEDALFEEVYTFGVYNTETKAIDIKWLVNETVKEVEIFVSDDNKKYKSVAKVKDTDEYSYEVKEEFDTIFFKVAYNDKDGKLHESFPFFIVLKDGKYVTDFIDSDEDGVADMVESVYGSKIDSADSDEDGLSDYEEIYITQTDPTVRDSFKKGISDADADCDEDGISNLSEIKYGIDPLREDTDDDRLSDLVEINELKTDPLIRDTDEDGLTDYAECKMGLDPLKPKTGDVPDAEAVIQQEIDTDSFVLEAVNADADNKAYKLSVDIKTAGFAEEVVSASKSRYTAVIDEEAVIGDIVDIVINNGAEPESMKLNFSISDDYKENVLGIYTGLEGIKHLSVFQYNEDIHMLIPMDTEYSEAEGIVSADIDGAGTYCIVDAERWFDSIGIKPEKSVPETPDTESLAMSSVADAVIGDAVTLKRNEPFSVYFLLQSSGKNGEENFNYQKKMIHDVANYLFNFYDDAAISIIPYDVETKLNPNYTYSSVRDLDKLDAILGKIEYDTELGYSDRYAAYELASKQLPTPSENYNSKYKRIVMNDQTIYSNYWAESQCVMTNVLSCFTVFGQIYCATHPNSVLGLSRAAYPDTTNNSGNSSQKTICVEGLDAEFDTEKNYDDVLGFVSRCVIKYNNYEAPADVSNIWAKLKGELSPDSDLDTDGDGIRDWDEIDSNYVTINPDGTYNFMTFEEIFKKVRISGNTPSQWRNTSHGDKYDKHLSETTVAVWKSDPTKEDTEGDKIKDKDDGDTFGPIDDHFQVVDDYSKVTYRDLLSLKQEKTLNEVNNSFPVLRVNLKTLNPITYLLYRGMELLDLKGLNPSTNALAAVAKDTNNLPSSLKELIELRGCVPNATAALTHYLDKSGTDLIFPDFPFAITLTENGRKRYNYNMNAFFDMVEKNTIAGHSYNFSTVRDIDKPGDENGSQTSWSCSYEDLSKYNLNASTDWWLTIGGCQTALAASVDCHKNLEGKVYYTAKIKYYFLDIYDWNKKSKIEKRFQDLHEAGYARCYLSYGYYETEIEWTEGARYPIPNCSTAFNMDQVSFDGICDPNFEVWKTKAEIFYDIV